MDALFLLGTTAEFCSISHETRRQVITEGCDAAGGRIPVVVNVSDTSLEESLRLATVAAKEGAAGVAICPPYYYAISQDDLLRYTRRFVGSVDLPVFLYNIPQNAHMEFAVETVRRLAELPDVVGLKNSSGSIHYVAEVGRVKAQRPEFSVLVGTEEIMVSAMEAGADGSVCGGANLFPSLYVKLFASIQNKQQPEMKRLQDLVVRVAGQIYTVGSAPGSYLRGLKAAMAALGVCGETLAEPLYVFNEEERGELRSRLNRLLPELP